MQSVQLPYVREFGQWALQMMAQHGYPAMFLILFIQEMGVPMPVLSGTAVLLFSGYMVYSGHMQFLPAMGVAILAALIGATVLYVAMRRGGRPLLYRYGRYVRLNERLLHRAEQLVARYEIVAFIPGRLVPSLRVHVSMLGSLLGIPYHRYMLTLFMGCILWSATYIGIGYFLGPAWQGFGHFIESHTWLLSVSIVAAAAVLVTRYWLRRARGRLHPVRAAAQQLEG